MVVWVGGLVFFASVMAPTAFHTMGTSPQFALLIGSSLGKLNQIGHMCGFVFILATLTFWSRAQPRGRGLLVTQMLLAVLMIAVTMVVQRSILPAMERDRIAAGGDILAAAPDNPARLDFERLHPMSEKVEGAALLLGVGVVVLMAAEPGSPRAGRIVET